MHPRLDPPAGLGVVVGDLLTSGCSDVIAEFSDGSVDRMGDKLDPNGWELRGYRANPVVLFAHDATAPPIGRTLNVFSDGLRLIGDIQFAEASVYEFADTIFRLVQAGYLKAGSVGFSPLEYSFANDPERPFGIDFERQELLEFSIVPVPALPSAVIQAQGIRPLHLSRLIGDAVHGTAASEPAFSEPPLAGCWRDRDRIHRRIRLLHLAPKETIAARRSYVEQLGELYDQLDAF
jgi:HK97 family phage prohead protease